MFTCTHIKLDVHRLVSSININIQVSDCGILFVQAPEFFLIYFIIPTRKQLRPLLQAEHFRMPTPHSRDPLNFKHREDEALQAKLTLKDFLNAWVFSLYFLILLYLKVNSKEKLFCRLLSFRPRDIQWSKINDTLPERAEISGPTFQISRLSQSHNGTYLCQAQNDYGRAADHYALLVYGK